MKDNRSRPERDNIGLSQKFAGLGRHGCSWMVKSIDKPSVSLSEASHEYLNHTFYYPGRVTWNSVSVYARRSSRARCSCHYDAGNGRLSGYSNPPKGYANAEDLANCSRNQNLQQAVLGDSYNNATGRRRRERAIEDWKLRNAWIKSVHAQWTGLQRRFSLSECKHGAKI